VPTPSVDIREARGPARSTTRATAQPVRRPDVVVDGVVAREAYAVSMDTFEGPLDLLLHLVRRHELDVLDIPISFITRKYLEFIEVAQALDIEVAGEYLVMAATLAFLKSRELLPSDPLPEEESAGREDGVDPRQELIRRLVEYEKFRMAGLELDARPIVGRDVFPRGGDVDVFPPEPDLAPVTLFRLAEAYGRILDRARILKTHDVDIEPVTVRQRMKQLSLLLGDAPRVEFEALFLDRTWSSERELRQMLVVTLMSVLEMVKLGVMSVQQPEGSETIVLERIGEAATVARVVETFREEDEAPPDLAKAAEDFELEQALAADLDGPDAADRGAAASPVSYARGAIDLSADELASVAAATFARGPDLGATRGVEASTERPDSPEGGGGLDGEGAAVGDHTRADAASPAAGTPITPPPAPLADGGDGNDPSLAPSPPSGTAPAPTADAAASDDPVSP
jgi:segregation and condensation protein A